MNLSAVCRETIYNFYCSRSFCFFDFRAAQPHYVYGAGCLSRIALIIDLFSKVQRVALIVVTYIKPELEQVV